VYFTYIDALFTAIQQIIPVKAAVVTLLDKVALSSRFPIVSMLGTTNREMNRAYIARSITILFNEVN